MSPKDKICYLHIGTHKTGSTTIQKFIMDSLGKLEDCGISVPSLGGAKIDQDHKLIALALQRLPQHGGDDEVLRKLGVQLRHEKRDIIISAETLAEKIVKAEVFARVKDYFEEHGYRMHVIVYLRDQASYINSRYVQDVKRFIYGGSFKERVKDILSRSRSSYDYWEYYQPMITAPDIKFDPRSFSKATETGLLEDFFSIIPVLADASWVKSYNTFKSLNPNAGAKSVFAARLIFNSVESIDSKRLKDRLRSKFKQTYLNKKWFEEPFIGLDDKMASAITSRYAKGNDMLAMKYWNCRWSDLNPTKTWTPMVFDFAHASGAEQRELLGVAAKFMGLTDGKRSSGAKPERSEASIGNKGKYTTCPLVISKWLSYFRSPKTD